MFTTFYVAGATLSVNPVQTQPSVPYFVTMDTVCTDRYATKKGDAYAIRFLTRETPLRNTWFIFEVRNLNDDEVTERGISFGRQFMKIIADRKDVTDKRLCDLALLRLKIALERKEPDVTANRPRPAVDCGYDLYDAESTDQPASMAAEKLKFEKLLRKFHRNPNASTAPRTLVPLRYGQAGIARRRWGS